MLLSANGKLTKQYNNGKNDHLKKGLLAKPVVEEATERVANEHSGGHSSEAKANCRHSLRLIAEHIRHHGHAGDVDQRRADALQRPRQQQQHKGLPQKVHYSVYK